MRRYPLFLATLLSVSFYARAENENNLGQSVWSDGSTVPPKLNHTWLGSLGMHYLVHVSTDLATWTFLPDFNPLGANAQLGIEIPIESPRIFTRIFQFDPTDITSFVDSDGDHLPDLWELYYFGDLSRDGTYNPDGDGLTAADEFALGLNPIVKDDGESATVIYTYTKNDELLTIKPAGGSVFSFSPDSEGNLLATP